MGLYRVSGINGTGDVSDILNETESNGQLYMAVQTLLKYGIMDFNGKVNDNLFPRLQQTLPGDEFAKVYEARQMLASASIAGLGENIAHALALVTLAVPRASFLSLVFYNVFGYATKLKHCIYSNDAMTEYYGPGKDKIYHLWYLSGGDFAKLEKMVKLGSGKKAILGGTTIGAGPTAAAASAAAIIAVLGPAIAMILKELKAKTGVDYTNDPTTGLPYGSPGTLPNTGLNPSGIMAWIQNNPALVIGGALLIWYVTKPKTKTSQQ